MKKYLITVSMIVLFSFTIFAGQSDKSYDSPIRVQKIDHSQYINANNIMMFVSNNGSIGRDVSNIFGYDYGTWYPYTSVDAIISNAGNAGYKSPLFQGGIWIGGKVSGETRLTMSEYRQEFTPGKMIGGTFDPDGASSGNTHYRTYKLYEDSLDSNPNTDYLEWPTEDGAPLNNYGEPYLLGNQTLWSVYNDADTSLHTSMSTDPLGLEVQQMTWADQSGSQFVDNVILQSYTIYNKGSNYITDCYIGIWLDPDLGDREDDLPGCDSTRNTFFIYNADNSDPNYGSSIPALGCRIIYGPKVPSPGDSSFFAGRFVPDHKNLKMTSFMAYINGADPDTPAEAYNLLQGRMMNGSAYYYMGDTLTYMFSGDPYSRVGDLASNQTDQKLVGAMGPFDFNPGDSQYVLIKIGIIYEFDYLTSVNYMKNILNEYINIPLDVADENSPELPTEFNLSQNYPNPFNPNTQISFTLPRKEDIKLEIFNLLGQKIITLADGLFSAGTHSVEWNGKDSDGEKISSGIYLYKISSENFSQTKKMCLIK